MIVTGLDAPSCVCTTEEFMCMVSASPPGMCFGFAVPHCSQMNGHMESWGRRGPLDVLKDTCGALWGLFMMDVVPLQVAVISLSRWKGQCSGILCLCVYTFQNSRLFVFLARNSFHTGGSWYNNHNKQSKT
ncbi:hypothetical protein AMECASPLE_019905 [Ameca splendens]|uniref:Uncharacterized protein n=1 Tax=Ameca splendens TaxID=208324 RepID=A0ABV0ZYS4_9TELE